MAQLSEIRAGLKTRLETVDLTVHAYWPNILVPPAIIIKRIGAPEPGTMGRGRIASFRIYATVALIDLEQGQATLDDYIDDTGTLSIIAALEADKTLGGVAKHIQFAQWTEEKSVMIAGAEVLSSTLDVDVHYTS